MYQNEFVSSPATQHQSSAPQLLTVVEKGSAVAEDYFDVVSAKEVKVGEYVRKISKNGSMLGKTYQRGLYDRSSQSYALTDCDDVNREVFVKGTIKLAIGFTY